MLRTLPKQTYCEDWTEVSREIRVRVLRRRRTTVYGSNNAEDEGPGIHQRKCKSNVESAWIAPYLF